MAPDQAQVDQLLSQSQTLKSQIAGVGEMRPGSLVERYRKCGKPNCHCAKRGAQGHGPDWILTREANGKTVTKAIPTGHAVQQTRAQIEEYKRFRDLTRELIQVNEQICDLRLRQPETVQAGDKKNRTRRRISRSNGLPLRRARGSSRSFRGNPRPRTRRVAWEPGLRHQLPKSSRSP